MNADIFESQKKKKNNPETYGGRIFKDPGADGADVNKTGAGENSATSNSTKEK